MPRFYGEDHPRSKLTRDQALWIRAFARPGTYSAIARSFGVTPQAVSYVVNGKNWKRL